MSELGAPGFNNVQYRDKPIKLGFTGTMRTIVMQKNNPNRLDMRYRTNRDFIAEQRKWAANATARQSNASPNQY